MNSRNHIRLVWDRTKTSGPCVLVLGMFDGVHEGHRELIRTAGREAEERNVPLQVCTFMPHPLQVLRPESAPRMLSTLAEKTEIFRKLGVDEIRVLRFTKELASMPPEVFLKQLQEMAAPCAVYAGWNYTFGRAGCGTAQMLEAEGPRYGFEARILPPVQTEDGMVISSSAIRASLLKGRLAEANIMLGNAYPVSGTVVEGKHLGHKLGFPTANVAVAAEKLLPDYGVYLCSLREGRRLYRGMVNIGRQPTLPSGEVTVEAYLLDASPDLYGKYVRLRLLKRIRPEHRFESAELLKEQLEKDRDTARTYFGMA
ncbi:MAG: bifunctional riboflavin kinase/FAD synthetase [Clostridia bacterium]|nr:bifunctional riboflavin kinase/FAD synthetase [Clostridia bacterium]